MLLKPRRQRSLDKKTRNFEKVETDFLWSSVPSHVAVAAPEDEDLAVTAADLVGEKVQSGVVACVFQKPILKYK